MEIKLGNKKTITSMAIFKIIFILLLIATIALMILNVLSDRNLITGMVIISSCATCMCYYFSEENN